MDETTIRDLEARRYAAMRAGDTAALGELLSEGLVYTHSNATSDSKASYLASLESGDLRYLEISHETNKVLPAGTAAVALGRMSARINSHGAERQIASTTLAVWAQEGGKWVLIAYQPTALPKS
jgi:ketosteroid isomerase-like protein